MSLQTSFERFLGICAAKALHREQPLIIGVAGSVGKSSTKQAIGIALGSMEAGSGVIATAKNYNNELGVPLTVFGAAAPGRSFFSWLSLLGNAFFTSIGLRSLKAKTYILEMGTDKPGDLHYLVTMALPQVGVLTAIGPEHTEFFGDVTEVAKEESTMVRCLPPHGIAILNADDPESQRISLPVGVARLTFGFHSEATARILETHIIVDEKSPEHSGMEMKLAVFGTPHTVRLQKAAGKPQAYAVAAALLTVAAIDGDDRLAVDRLQRQFEGMPGRMRVLRGVKQTWLLDDSYNSSPLAALSAVRDLAAFPISEGGKRIAALGDMLELGALSEDAHIQLGRMVAECGIDMLVTCGKLAHATGRAALEAGLAEEAIIHFDQSADAGRFIQDRMHPGDVVLIKGSQGARMERITKELMDHPEKAEQLIVRQTSDWLAKT